MATRTQDRDGRSTFLVTFDPIPIEDLREAFHALHAALVV
jgi:hypothetical protein